MLHLWIHIGGIYITYPLRPAKLGSEGRIRARNKEPFQRRNSRRRMATPPSGSRRSCSRRKGEGHEDDDTTRPARRRAPCACPSLAPQIGTLTKLLHPRICGGSWILRSPSARRLPGRSP